MVIITVNLKVFRASQCCNESNSGAQKAAQLFSLYGQLTDSCCALNGYWQLQSSPFSPSNTVFTKKVTVCGHEYDLHLVDTAGQDEFSIMPPNYSLDIHGYVLVYSIDSKKSFDVCQTLQEKLVDLIGSNR